MFFTRRPKVVDFIDNPSRTMTAADVKKKGGYDTVFNGGLYDMTTGAPCCDIRIDGKTLSDDQWGYWGYGWNKGKSLEVVHTNNMNSYDNYLTCIWCIINGEKEYLNNNAAGIGGKRGRTAFGLKANGEMVCSITTDANDPLYLTEVRDRLFNAGCISGIILDGGGSSQVDDYLLGKLVSSRKTRNYIGIIWEKEPATAPPKTHTILKPDLVFRSPLAKITGSITYLIQHHAAGYGSVYDIHNYHKNALGWLGIAYNYYVRMNGDIYQGRPEGTVGGHTTGYSNNSIGICSEGNFEVDQMPEAQREALRWLIADIKSRRPSIIAKKHSQLNATACPGKNYPWDYVNGGAVPTPTPTPTPTPSGDKETMKGFQTWLNANYAGGLVVDGIYGANTKKAAVRAYQSYLNSTYKSGLISDGIFGSKTKAAVRIIAKNDKGNHVNILQGLLCANGYDTKGIDGIFGTNTFTATTAYQKSKGLIADGIAGKNTIEKLMI